MIRFSRKYRSDQEEVMDDFEFHGLELNYLLNDLKRVNYYLGGNRITYSGMGQLLSDWNKEEHLVIVDVGCGDGEMLRMCHKWLRKKQFLNYQLIGLDANINIVELARKRSMGFDNLSFEQVDVLSPEMDKYQFDIALLSLFLHHFKNEQIDTILGKVNACTKLGTIVNDLQRHPLAFGLFKIIGRVLLRTKTAYNDGLISIARGFTVTELHRFSSRINGKHHIRNKWAFRLQWVIDKRL